MITKFTLYNESISSLLVGPTKEEVWTYLMNGKLKGLIKSVPKSPEDFFNQIKDDCIIMRKSYNYVYWGKDNTTLFRQDSIHGYLYISYEYIWSIFEIVYELNFDEICKLIKDELIENINWNRLIPRSVTFVSGYDY